MHHDNEAEHDGTGQDEVVAEFDQTNGKAEGLVGDTEFDEDLDAGGDGSEDGRGEPLVTTLVEDLADGGSDEERRD